MIRLAILALFLSSLAALAQLIPGRGAMVPNQLGGTAPIDSCPANGITITNIASNSGTGVNTVVVTVPGGGVPVGNALGIIVIDSSNVAGGVTDTPGSGYTNISQNAPANVATLAVFVSASGHAFAGGNTITYTLGQAGHAATVNAFYVSGVDLALGNDIVEFLGSGAGTSTAPSATTIAPTVSCALFVGAVGAASAVTSFTQDTINAAWATPPGQVQITAPMLVGGSFVSPGLGGRTYAPTLGTSAAWAELIMAIKPGTPPACNGVLDLSTGCAQLVAFGGLF